MIDFYSEIEYQALLQNKRKLKNILLIVSTIGILISVLLYVLTTRENQSVMKIILCIWVVLFLYIDFFTYFELCRNNDKYIKHFTQTNKYDEVVLEEFTLKLTDEEYTKDKITFVVAEVVCNNKKSIYYLKKDAINKCDFSKCKKLFIRGHYITKVEGGV